MEILVSLIIRLKVSLYSLTNERPVIKTPGVLQSALELKSGQKRLQSLHCFCVSYRILENLNLACLLACLLRVHYKILSL